MQSCSYGECAICRWGHIWGKPVVKAEATPSAPCALLALARWMHGKRLYLYVASLGSEVSATCACMFYGNGVGLQCLFPIVGGYECMLSLGLYLGVCEVVGMVSVRYFDLGICWVRLL